MHRRTRTYRKTGLIDLHLTKNTLALLVQNQSSWDKERMHQVSSDLKKAVCVFWMRIRSFLGWPAKLSTQVQKVKPIMTSKALQLGLPQDFSGESLEYSFVSTEEAQLPPSPPFPSPHCRPFSAAATFAPHRQFCGSFQQETQMFHGGVVALACSSNGHVWKSWKAD